MRRIGLADLHHAARALAERPVSERVDYAADLIWRAHVADKTVKRLRKLHPRWGDGSLRTVALADLRGATTTRGHGGTAEAMTEVLNALTIWRRRAGDKARVCIAPNCARFASDKETRNSSDGHPEKQARRCGSSLEPDQI